MLRTVFILDNSRIFQITEDTLEGRWKQRVSNSNEEIVHQIISETSLSLFILPECFQVVHGECVGTLFDIETIDVALGRGVGGEDRFQLRFQFTVVLLEKAELNSGVEREWMLL